MYAMYANASKTTPSYTHVSLNLMWRVQAPTPPPLRVKSSYYQYDLECYWPILSKVLSPCDIHQISMFDWCYNFDTT